MLSPGVLTGPMHPHGRPALQSSVVGAAGRKRRREDRHPGQRTGRRPRRSAGTAAAPMAASGPSERPVHTTGRASRLRRAQARSGRRVTSASRDRAAGKSGQELPHRSHRLLQTRRCRGPGAGKRGRLQGQLSFLPSPVARRFLMTGQGGHALGRCKPRPLGPCPPRALPTAPCPAGHFHPCLCRNPGKARRWQVVATRVNVV